jgi:hypothetical protein
MLRGRAVFLSRSCHPVRNQGVVVVVLAVVLAAAAGRNLGVVAVLSLVLPTTVLPRTVLQMYFLPRFAVKNVVPMFVWRELSPLAIRTGFNTTPPNPTAHTPTGRDSWPSLFRMPRDVACQRQTSMAVANLSMG